MSERVIIVCDAVSASGLPCGEEIDSIHAHGAGWYTVAMSRFASDVYTTRHACSARCLQSLAPYPTPPSPTKEKA